MNPTVMTETLISIWVIGYVMFWALPRLRRENFRTDIRALRDDLFDYMWENGHSFDTPAYRETRQSLNGIIRMSNSLSCLNFIVLVIHYFRHGESNLEDAAARMPDGPLRKEIERVRRQAVIRLLKFVFLEGITGIVLRCLVRVLSRVSRLKDGVFALGAWTLGWFRRQEDAHVPPPRNSLIHA